MKSLLLGRWQPLHAGHRALIQHELDAGHEVIVGIRDTRLGADNPYTVLERIDLIRAAYGPSVDVCVVPDFDEIVYGRKVGYGFRKVELPDAVQVVSGTETRKQPADIVWLTGNSGAGKTTLAKALAPYLGAVILDGDEMRASISLGAGFSYDERRVHNLRVARLAKVLSEQGRPVVVAVIAPTPIIRRAVATVCHPCWVYVNRELAPDPERPYEPPIAPHCEVRPDVQSVAQEVDTVLRTLGIR